jgi:hypothetical protein
MPNPEKSSETIEQRLRWRVGGKVPLNVYENDEPMFQCHTPEDAARIVAMLNAIEEVDDVLVVNWVGPRVDGDYRKALHDLVTRAIAIENDPQVSESAAKRKAELRAALGDRALPHDMTVATMKAIAELVSNRGWHVTYGKMLYAWSDWLTARKKGSP